MKIDDQVVCTEDESIRGKVVDIADGGTIAKVWIEGSEDEHEWIPASDLEIV